MYYFYFISLHLKIWWPKDVCVEVGRELLFIYFNHPFLCSLECLFVVLDFKAEFLITSDFLFQSVCLPLYFGKFPQFCLPVLLFIFFFFSFLFLAIKFLISNNPFLHRNFLLSLFSIAFCHYLTQRSKHSSLNSNSHMW